MRDSKLAEYELKYKNSIQEWKKEKKLVDKFNFQKDEEYKVTVRAWENELIQYGKRREEFILSREDFNHK